MWMADSQTKGMVVGERAPQSYEVFTLSGTLRRNRNHLNHLPKGAPAQKQSAESPQSADISKDQQTTAVDKVPVQQASSRTDLTSTLTRSGRISRPPSRFYPTQQR